jgi:hypothetical protein
MHMHTWYMKTRSTLRRFSVALRALRAQLIPDAVGVQLVCFQVTQQAWCAEISHKNLRIADLEALNRMLQILGAVPCPVPPQQLDRNPQ